ncbi:MAG: hypothetical protein QUV08_13280 [Parasphingorhabdus sp.]|nr:hypothetical protein [Parasphingorhabdus sp.]
MKIVDVCAFYSPMGGGVKTYVRQKLAIGPTLGHEIVIIVPGSGHGVEHFGRDARIVTIPGKKFPLDGRYHYFDDAGEVHAALTREQPDYVEASSPWNSASIVADWPGAAPRALIMHADPLSAYAYRWFGKILRVPLLIGSLTGSGGICGVWIPATIMSFARGTVLQTD